MTHPSDTSPIRLGPYRLEAKVGAGGMGEVYRAYDERLHRTVALKLIRSDHAPDAPRRARFLREARAAARLNHRAVAQVHDVLDADGLDAIVMEWIDGESLAHRLRSRPMALDAILRVARDVAEGLDAAHSAGVLHRDLKTENVMVTADGHAKLVDFGVACALQDDEGFPRLTAEGTVMGTHRALSPEQARGLPLDERSDIFAFGTLLYEVLGGNGSPFARNHPGDTLLAVCTFEPPPLRQVQPQVPEGLSALVAEMLAKDPDRRPASARKVALRLAALSSGSGPALAAADDLPTLGHSTPTPLPAPPRRRLPAGVLAGGSGLAALALGAGAVWWFSRPPALVTVAVPAVVVEGADSAPADVHRLADAIRSALLAGILARSGLAPLSPEHVDAALGEPGKVARATAADEVLASSLSCGERSCDVVLRRIGGADGHLRWTGRFTVLREQPAVVDEVVGGQLRSAFPAHRSRSGVARLEVRAEDYERYLRLRRGLADAGGQVPSPDEYLRELEAIRAGSPRFLESFTFAAWILKQRFPSSRSPADLDEALRLVERARSLAPEDPRPLTLLFDIGIVAGRPELAEEALRTLEALQPGDEDVTVRRARLAEQGGDREKALALLRGVVARRPSWTHLMRVAAMEFRQGDADAARGHLEDLLGRLPGYRPARSLLAQVALSYGDPNEAVAIYRELVTETPQMGDWSNLGLAHLLLRNLAEAEEAFRRASSLAPENPFVALNLADVQFLAGRRDEAAAGYRRVLELTAADSKDWQVLSTRAQALAHLGRGAEAVELVEGMLRSEPTHARVRYEAALVHAVLDDRTSATVNAVKAARGGVISRWFDLPWFDSIRSAPELQSALAAEATARPPR